MSRPQSSVLFTQTFVHPQLDEYVDEVIFAEPIVISACEFLEQNASSASPVVALVGATSPPSFALEVFVQCEGEPRFRRLCQPFLYSHSSSNVLEVEAVVTNHLVVRGSYRSLTLVVYGNTAEDLGEFNIEFGLDSSLENLICSQAEGKLEDLPPALHSTKLSLEESISSIRSLFVPVAEPDLCFETKQFVLLIIKTLDASNLGDCIHKVVSTVASGVSSYASCDLHNLAITWDKNDQTNFLHCKKESLSFLTEARNELLQLYKAVQQESESAESLEECGLDSEISLDTLTFELLPAVFSLFERNSSTDEHPSLSQNESMLVGLSVVLLLCSGKESCFHFVNGSGMEQLARIFCPETKKSTSIMLMLLGVIERATRYSIGCEGFLGWWPREDENVPIGCSEGYSQILKLLLQKQRHDVASLGTYILHRLRFYEVATRYECAVLSILGGLSAVGRVRSVSVGLLISAKLQLKKLLKLLNSCGPIEDPSPAGYADKQLILGQSEGMLSYKATINLIASSKSSFSDCDIDPHLLSLLKERGFLPISAALLSSTSLRSEKGHIMDVFMDIASTIESILLSLLYCRSGLLFLLIQPEITAAVILSLQGFKDTNMEECVPLRYASVLLSKGFFCRPREVGVITELHLRVVNAIDRLLTSNPGTEEHLWVLWELCGLSMSDSGRQALMAAGHFPEALIVLMEALRSVKDVEPDMLNTGSSPINLAIFHSAAEIFEVIVTDSTASSMYCWIEHAVELHKALHSFSPGSNRKDAPTRLLEWIDAGVVYHKNGAIGLLRYAAVLASGGDAHLTSASILVSDSMDIENVVGDSANGSDSQVMENLLGKLVSDKNFVGVALRDSSVAQLTTTFRILSFISENPTAAAALYEEGALTLIYVVLINCKFMLERSSNTYDYLVDEGAECNSTADLLSERSREQSLIDLIIPSLLLLVTLLQKLQDAKEQHRNTKLLNALLQLHREVSLKLAACAADISSPYPGLALGFGAVCHLLASAAACWPVFGWTPGLFHCLLDSVQATSLLALGPKEACSLLYLLGDLFPEEGIWLWKDGMPSLSALRTLSSGTLLGPQKEKQVNWYLQPGHAATLLSRLTPLLDKIAQIILHFAFTSLVVIQDMMRVFIVRLACQKADSAVVLLRPIITWIDDHVSEASPLFDTDVFKVYRLLDFITSLLEHPRTKAVLLKEGVVGLLTKALKRCADTSISEGNLPSEPIFPTKTVFTLLGWCFPLFKSFSVIFASQASLQHSGLNENSSEKLGSEDCLLILHQLLKLCQVLPVGKELAACLCIFKELAAFSEGRNSFASIAIQIQSSCFEKHESERRHEQDGSLYDFEWKRHPPFLNCCKNLLMSIDGENSLSTYAIEALGALYSGALCFCMEGTRLNLQRVSVLKCLFGVSFDLDGIEHCPEDKFEDACKLIALLDMRVSESESSATSSMQTTFFQVKKISKSLVMLLEKPTASIKVDDMNASEGFTFSSSDILDLSKSFLPHYLFQFPNMRGSKNEDARSSLFWTRKSDGYAEMSDDFFSLGGLTDKFMWECPDSSPLLGKRKMASMEGPNRRARGENSGAAICPNVLPRGIGPPMPSNGPTRKDTFRQGKPNTSRPRSMHVDDYVARERNVDGVSSGSNFVRSMQRGPSGRRPSSIHVDEFMARQRECQVPVPMAVGKTAALGRNAPTENENVPEKLDKSRQLKIDLDDDLQEINIVFDGDESDDRLPFPQPGDNLLPAPVIIEGSCPRSIVEETESGVNGSTHISNMGMPSASNVDESTKSEFSSKRSISRPEMPLSRESSVSSERKYYGANLEKPFSREQSDEMKHAVPVVSSKGFDSSTAANMSGFPVPFYSKGSALSPQVVGDSRMPPNFCKRGSPQPAINVPLAAGSQGRYDQKPLLNQPPLPPLPPPPTVSSIVPQNAEAVQSHSSPYGHSMRDLLPPFPTGYPLQAFDASGSGVLPPLHAQQVRVDYLSTFNHASVATSTSPHSMLDSKYPRANVSSGSRLHDDTSSSASGSSRHSQPPLPPMPPPFSSASFAQSSVKSSTSQSSVYSQTSGGISQIPLSTSPNRLGTFSVSEGSLTSYSAPHAPPPLLISRPSAISGTVFSGSASGSTPQTSMLSVQPRVQLQPLQQPQPPHPPQQLRPPFQVSQLKSDQGVSLQQTPIQVQGQPFQLQQQSHITPLQVHFQPQLPEHLAQQQQQQQQQQLQSHQQLQLHQQQQQQHKQLQLHQQQLQLHQQQQQQDPSIYLQQILDDPNFIQSLLSDEDKLCQLLEQYPKIMDMLQEKLGQP